jgi:transmembrane sensor
MNESIDDLLSQGRDEEVKAIINAMLQEPTQTPMPPEAAAGVLEAITAADAAHNTHKTPVVNMQSARKRRLYAACAAMIITILGAGYFWLHTTNPNKEIKQEKTTAHTTAAILPGGDNAVLTLSDGRQIILDSSSAGGLALQGSTKVLILDKGKLAYQPYGKNEGPELYNTVSTPNGGRYQIVLPDGTRVWLNAASSIRFPTTFTGERNITMTGEAYFEVVHDKNHPFKVSANNLLVEVLGTHFNMNAYSNETATKTTLLEGKVKIAAIGNRQSAKDAERAIVLKPGEQAALAADIADSRFTIADADVAKVIAWKNGLFNLSGADLKDFLRQVERWYNITVQYESPVPLIEFQGKLNRAVPLSDIIDYLKNLGIECSLNGKTLSVKGK